MTPTTELREQLRAALNEQIPAGGSEADTAFTDAQLDAWLIEPSESLEEAAWRGWVLKMGWVLSSSQSSSTVIERSVGSERIKFGAADAKTAFNHAREMADYYFSLIPEPASAQSRLFSMEAQNILGPEVLCFDDLSRLLPESVGWC